MRCVRKNNPLKKPAVKTRNKNANKKARRSTGGLCITT